jgi:hypothetical protein
MIRPVACHTDSATIRRHHQVTETRQTKPVRAEVCPERKEDLM